MRSDAGSTTVTPSSTPRHQGGPDGLAIAWLFPRPDQPATGFSACGENELILGRDETCAVKLTGNDVSRRHASLRRSASDSSVILKDLDSRNGVRVNGLRVGSTQLGAGDVVRIGGWVGVVTATPGDFKELAPDLLGGRALQSALSPIRLAAPSDLPIVLEGETGTGKEVVTRALHQWSGRPGALVAVNCAALPEALAEGELFGYRRGAFTGADRASPGFFRSADGGTLLLDEISDLALPLQAKLLRVLEQREVQPLGESRPVPVDVRMVAAGQQSLMDAVRQGRFRADLLARLEGITVRLPPLRERREDLPPLFSELLKRQSQGRAPAVESDFIERLCLYDWPFNIRELVLLVRRLLVLHHGEPTLRARHLPERVGDQVCLGGKGAAGKSLGGGATPVPPAEPLELPALVAALRASGGNVARASAMLGITRQRAYRLLEGQVDLEAIRNEQEPRR